MEREEVGDHVRVSPARPDWMWRTIVVQSALILLILFGVIVAPPRQGAMLVVPLIPSSVGSTANWALRAGASILGYGPTPGSLIVFGERDRLEAFRHGSLVVAAPRRLCGSYEISGDDRVAP